MVLTCVEEPSDDTASSDEAVTVVLGSCCANCVETSRPSNEGQQSNKHLHQISQRYLTHYTTGHRGQHNTHYQLTTYPSSTQSTHGMTTDYKLQQNRQTVTHHKKSDTIYPRHRVRFRSDHNTHQNTHCQ